MSVQDMHERLKKANERRNCGADEEIARLRAANAELSVTIQKLRKALTYYAEQEYNPSRADDGVIAREALK